MCEAHGTFVCVHLCAGVVHMLGGFASLVGSIATGPRTGRFDSLLPKAAFKGGSPPLFVLGTLLLWFGWVSADPFVWPYVCSSAALKLPLSAAFKLPSSP